MTFLTLSLPVRGPEPWRAQMLKNADQTSQEHQASGQRLQGLSVEPCSESLKSSFLRPLDTPKREKILRGIGDTQKNSPRAGFYLQLRLETCLWGGGRAYGRGGWALMLLSLLCAPRQGQSGGTALEGHRCRGQRPVAVGRHWPCLLSASHSDKRIWCALASLYSCCPQQVCPGEGRGSLRGFSLPTADTALTHRPVHLSGQQGPHFSSACSDFTGQGQPKVTACHSTSPDTQLWPHGATGPTKWAGALAAGLQKRGP